MRQLKQSFGFTSVILCQLPTSLSRPGGLDQRDDGLPDVLGKVGPCGNDGGTGWVNTLMQSVGTSRSTSVRVSPDKIVVSGYGFAILRCRFAALGAGSRRFKSCRPELDPSSRPSAIRPKG